MRLPFLLLTLVLCNAAFASEVREVYYQGAVTPTNTAPTFDKGYLFVYNFHAVDVYAPDGSPMYSASAEIPHAKIANIENAAADTDGTVAGAVEYSRDGTGRTIGGGIAVFDRSGRQVKFFDTGAYLPTQVCFGPDHSIWTLGWLGVGATGKNQDYFILRKYSQDGRELGAFLPRSTFDSEWDPVGPMVGMWQLRISSGRIGALFYESNVVKMGQGPNPAEQWVETDLKGNVLGRWDIGSHGDPRAFTASGALYGQNGKLISVFDRTAKTWRNLISESDGFLVGADGNDLVFWIRGTSTLRWAPAAQ